MRRLLQLYRSSGQNSGVRAAYLWTALGNFFRYASGFFISVTLARLLPPSAYGIIGMVTVAMTFPEILQDTGITQSVVYFREDRDLAKYFTISVALGAIFTLITWFAAPLIAIFYHEPLVVPVLRFLGFTFPLSAMKGVSVAALSRELRFREIAIVETATSIGCGIIAVALAFLGFGVWSLASNIMILLISQSVAFGWYVRPRFTWRIELEPLKKVLRWGMPLSGASLLWQFYDQADYIVVGRMMGTVPLGWYTFAFRLATMVNEKISAVINRVSLPSFSSMRDDPKRLAEHWFSVSRKLALVNFSLLAALGANAADLIHVAVGDKWLPAAMPLRFLCFVGALRTVLPVVPNVLSACGKTGKVFRYTILNVIVLPTAFAAGCHYAGLLGVGIAWCVALPFTALFLVIPAVRVLGLSLRDYVGNLRQPAVIAVLCLLAMLPFEFVGMAPFLRMVLRSAAGLACYIACVWRLPEVRGIVEGLRHRVSALQMPPAAGEMQKSNSPSAV